MSRLAMAVVFSFLAIGAVAQVVPTSDPLAISLAQKSIAALTGGSAPQDVTLNASVISILGSDYETGTGTLTAQGYSQSRIDVNLSNGNRSDVRSMTSAGPTGAWQRN